jgi:hypothetical protein
MTHAIWYVLPEGTIARGGWAFYAYDLLTILPITYYAFFYTPKQK